MYKIDAGEKRIKPNSEVYLSGISDINFPSKLDESGSRRPEQFSHEIKRKILSNLITKPAQKNEEFYFRINSMEWLRNMNLNELDGLFLSFSKISSRFNAEVPLIQEFKNKIYFELPKFIKEDSIKFYADLIARMVGSGIRNFVISHLSQIKLNLEKCRIITNEKCVCV